MSRKKTYEEVKQLFTERGFILVSKEYISAHVKLEYLCPQHGSQFITYDKLNQGKGCPKCAGKNKTIEDIRELTKDTGYELVSTKYIGAHSKLEFICKEHGIFSISYASISQGHGCANCSFDNIGNIKRTDVNTVIEAFANKGYKLISNYINKGLKLEFICPFHGIQTTTYANIRDGGGCDKCARESYSGENHHNWDGGITEIHEYVRKHCVTQYHKEIMNNADYTCLISGNRSGGLEVHHTYGFNIILKDTLKTLCLPIHRTVSSYTEDQLKSIKAIFTKIQAMYESAVLTKGIHKLFHDIYGYGNNTPQQFQEFRERYDNNEFADRLRAS